MRANLFPPLNIHVHSNLVSSESSAVRADQVFWSCFEKVEAFFQTHVEV